MSALDKRAYLRVDDDLRTLPDPRGDLANLCQRTWSLNVQRRGRENAHDARSAYLVSVPGEDGGSLLTKCGHAFGVITGHAQHWLLLRLQRERVT